MTEETAPKRTLAEIGDEIEEFEMSLIQERTQKFNDAKINEDMAALFRGERITRIVEMPGTTITLRSLKPIEYSLARFASSLMDEDEKVIRDENGLPKLDPDTYQRYIVALSVWNIEIDGASLFLTIYPKNSISDEEKDITQKALNLILNL